MKTYPTSNIRNVALVGHGHSGKTTLTEAMLFASGGIQRLGRVDDGNTTSDYDPEEVKRKISISTATAPCEWKDHKINVLDTPGYADFIGEALGAVRVADNMVIVVDGVGGVEVQTEKMWQTAENERLPRLIFINRLDKEHSDFDKTLADLRAGFGQSVIPLQLPIGKETAFSGVADVIERRAYTYSGENKFSEGDLPDDLATAAGEHRDKIMEAVAEADDQLLEKYLETGELSDQEVVQGIGKAVAAGSLVPVLCGSAHKTIGVSQLLDRIVSILVAPDSREVIAREPKTDKEVTLKASPNEPLAAFVFKTVADPYVGKLSYFRVYSGTFRADSQIYDVQKGKRERVGHVFFMRGKQQIEAKEVPAGDIAAAPKLAETTTSATLTDESRPVALPALELPAPLVSVAVTPKTKGDDEKLGTSIIKMTEEDPTLRSVRDPATREMVVSGVGDLHLEVVLDRLNRRYGVEAQTSVPKIPYRETIKGKARVQGKYKKQTGGRGQYGDVWLEIEPLPRGGGYEFVDKIVGGVVPQNFRPAVDKGIREATEGGVRTTYPTVDVRVRLVDGSYHPVDSSEMAFKIAGSMAFKKAIMEAKPVLLEPLYDVEITVPEANMGDVMGDLSSKRGKILGMEPKGRWQVIKAQVPLAELSRYATELRSLTGGYASFTMTFSRYEEVPAEAEHKVVAAAQKKEEEHA